MLLVAGGGGRDVRWSARRPVRWLLDRRWGSRRQCRTYGCGPSRSQVQPVLLYRRGRSGTPEVGLDEVAEGGRQAAGAIREGGLGLAEYSDTTEQVFRDALTDLKGAVPDALHEELALLLKQGEFHSTTRIEAAIRETIAITSVPVE